MFTPQAKELAELAQKAVVESKRGLLYFWLDNSQGGQS
jgi:hypothetical protein